MAHEAITLKASDGDCPTQVFTPEGRHEGEGAWPAVIIYMDAGGIRPAIEHMAQRLADNGYVVLLPDLFYRFGPYGPLVPKEVFAGDFRSIIGPMMATTGNDKAGADTKSFMDYLAQRSDVKGKVGTVGFCMGGGMALTAAGLYPDRVAAAISFHGGRLADDSPHSPHLLAPKIKAEVYLAHADNDSSCPPEMITRLDKALGDAGVRFKSETYAGAAHGWMKPDFPVYDEAAAERGWEAMLDLFARNLRAG